MIITKCRALVCTYAYVKKAAKTTFVRKTRAFNVDEIDTLLFIDERVPCMKDNVTSWSEMVFKLSET